MSEYWKSIPKIYCKFCNVWYQDNKSSKDFHERSFKHKNNINRHINELGKRGHEKDKEEAEFRREMQKIERAATIAYEKDLAESGQSSSSGVSSSFKIKTISEDKLATFDHRELPSDTNEHLRKEALEIVTSKLKKKHEWFESKTIEGKVYFYNKLTMETKWTEPKSGYISIKEQKEMQITGVPGDQSKKEDQDEDVPLFKHEQFASGWQEVRSQDSKLELDLPEKAKKKPQNSLLIDLEEPERLEAKEKVVQSDLIPSSKLKKKNQTSFEGFKKRKLNNSDCRRIKSSDE